MLVEQVKKMNEILYDEITRIKIKDKRPMFIIAGDMNRKDCSCFSNFSDITLVETAPTRKSINLDLCYTNLYVESNNVSIPLWSSSVTVSDHRVVLFNAAFLGLKHTYKTVIRRKFSAKSEEKFCSLIENFDWSYINNFIGAESKCAFLHEKIEEFKDICFPIKKSRIRSDEDPWITDHIRKMIKKRNATFQSDGREERWKNMRDNVRLQMERSKRAYYDREVEKIRNASNKRGLAYTALKNLSSAERPKPWAVTDIDWGREEEELVEELAVYFNSVTNDYDLVDVNTIESTYDRPMYELTPAMVEQCI